MADPLDALRSPVPPIAPDPAFAARLRARLVAALRRGPEPRGEPMTATLTTDPIVTPYLAVADARRALDWYVDALGFVPRGEPIVMPDGRIGHAELALGGGVVMLSDAYPEIGVVAPAADAGATVTMHLTVDDVDVVTHRAVRAGAVLDREPADHPYGRNAVIRDPFGHRWMLAGPVRTEYSPRHGDLSYVSLWVDDPQRAADFFGRVLGWRFRDGGHQVDGLSLHHGIWRGEAYHGLFVCIAVDDLDAAVRRVRAAGGTASDPHDEPYGRIADCADDQGMPFALHQASPGGQRGPVNGERHGDVSYVTIEVVDSARFRRFFADVVGWRFSPGRVDDGWGAEDSVPMIGIHGGHDVVTGVPMYRVDDIHAAVAAVRAAGGTATDPEQQPYGISATCTDDQGTRFYLGQH